MDVKDEEEREEGLKSVLRGAGRDDYVVLKAVVGHVRR